MKINQKKKSGERGQLAPWKERASANFVNKAQKYFSIT